MTTPESDQASKESEKEKPKKKKILATDAKKKKEHIMTTPKVTKKVNKVGRRSQRKRK